MISVLHPKPLKTKPVLLGTPHNSIYPKDLCKSTLMLPLQTFNSRLRFLLQLRGLLLWMLSLLLFMPCLDGLLPLAHQPQLLTQLSFAIRPPLNDLSPADMPFLPASGPENSSQPRALFPSTREGRVRVGEHNK